MIFHSWRRLCKKSLFQVKVRLILLWSKGYINPACLILFYITKNHFFNENKTKSNEFGEVNNDGKTKNLDSCSLADCSCWIHGSKQKFCRMVSEPWSRNETVEMCQKMVQLLPEQIWLPQQTGLPPEHQQQRAEMRRVLQRKMLRRSARIQSMWW